MGWTTEEGLHEGYLVPQFVDGQRAVGVTGGGIPDDQVHVSGLCTATLNETFFSYRREGEAAGRIAAVIRASG